MLTGPVPVTEKILRDSGMAIGDIDLFEVNEAFAAVVLRFMQAFDVDPARVNVNGGAIAMGHPLGATGAMILGTLLDELERSGKGTGLATLCIGGGMGAATIIEGSRWPMIDQPALPGHRPARATPSPMRSQMAGRWSLRLWRGGRADAVRRRTS